MKSLNLPNIFDKRKNGDLSKIAWKKLVNKAINENEESNFKKAFVSKSKLKDSDMPK
jgi:hypothetical protein